MTGEPTSENLTAAAERYVRANRNHKQKYGEAPILKCVHIDPTTGAETIVGTAQWYIYPRQRSADEARSLHELLACDWLPDGPDKAKVLAFIQPFIDGRFRHLGVEPHGVLMYMAVSPAWRRKGAATKCVQYGLDRCEELGVPAYLEASDEGRPMYEKMGFETLERITVEWKGRPFVLPAMIKRPVVARQE